MVGYRPVFKGIGSCLPLIVAVGLLGLGTACSDSSRAQPEDLTNVVPATEIVALGRLTPKGEVIKLSVPYAEDSRVNQILVEEGDWVREGQVIATLQGLERKQRDLEEALKNVDYYRAILEKTQLGEAKEAEIAAQRANIARVEAQLRNEEIERQAAIAASEAELRQAELIFRRNEILQREGAVSQQELDQTREQFKMAQAELEQKQAQLNNTLQTLQEQIAQEQGNLETLKEVRPVDVQIAQAELDKAMIAVEQRKADLEDTRVRVPVSGQILRINTRVGEQVNTEQGIVELGQTRQMYAIAEVHETEVSKIRPGQQAIIKSEYGGFEGQVRGTVEQIGLQIGERTLTEGSSNPTVDEDARVVEVKIRITPEDSPKVANLTNMQVRVEIDLASRK